MFICDAWRLFFFFKSQLCSRECERLQTHIGSRCMKPPFVYQRLSAWNERGKAYALPRRSTEKADGISCEQGAPTLYGSASNGQRVLPLPPSLHPQEKKRLYSPWRRVGGYDCSHVFDGDGIHSLANTENKIPEIPKPPVCVAAGGSCMWFTEGWWHESFVWGKIWNKHLASWGQNLVTWVTQITRPLQEGHDFTHLQKCAHLQVNFSFGLSSCETVELLHMRRDECG